MNLEVSYDQNLAVLGDKRLVFLDTRDKGCSACMLCGTDHCVSAPCIRILRKDGRSGVWIEAGKEVYEH